MKKTIKKIKTKIYYAIAIAAIVALVLLEYNYRKNGKINIILDEEKVDEPRER